jgi:hypothetical protein
MSNEESKSNNKEDFGGYRGGMLRWNTMKKRSRYVRRYNKDSEMMRRILSTTISN